MTFAHKRVMHSYGIELRKGEQLIMEEIHIITDDCAIVNELRKTCMQLQNS